MTRSKSIIGGIIVVFFLGVFLWPTMFRYEKVKIDDNEQLIRINRITGKAESFMQGEWLGKRKILDVDSLIVLPMSARKEVTGKAWLNYDKFQVELYNGSKWTLTQATIRVILNGLDGTAKWNRKFQKDLYINPFSVGTFSFPVIEIENMSDFDWNVDELRGFVENNPFYPE